MPRPRPVVAVTGRHLEAGRVTSWSNPAVAIQRGYTDALARAGALAVVVPPMVLTGERDAHDLLAPFAGLVLSGGADVDPRLYGQEPGASVYGIDAVRDRLEMALVDAALARGVPVLAICRGHQLLNVALGGTLQQHVDEGRGGVVHGDPLGGTGGVLHDVTVEEATRLADALGTTRCAVHSHHHQAIDELTPKATATAWSDDGLVEGFELAGAWVVSVQWHPEVTAADDPVQQRLFDAFVAAC